jgi:hypothetical protein
VMDGRTPPFSTDHANALAVLLLRLNHHGQTLFTMFYGVGTLLFGVLMFRSRLLPAAISFAVMAAAVGFVTRTLTWVAAPEYATPLFLAPAGVAFLVLSLWLVTKGIDAERWVEQADRQAGVLVR